VLAGRGVPMEEILIGVFAWQFTVQSIHSGVNCVTGNANLVKKIFFPRSILPVSATLANLVGYALTLVVQLVLVAVLLHVHGRALSPWAVALPAVIALHTVFNLGLAMTLGAANAYFRDTQHIVNVATSAWFFVSPVMYNLDLLASFAAGRPWVMDLYLLNPLAVIITAYRALQLPGAAFPWTAWSAAGLAWPLAFAGLAAWFYRRAQRNFADVL
jgi:ABC-type polysaccharide/polyol phosphate export permease